MRKRDLGILIICAFAILWSFRGEQGSYYFVESWLQPIDTTLYSNLHFPTKFEKLPKPLLTDLDGDERNEIVFATRDCSLQIVDVSLSDTITSTNSLPLVKAQSTLLRTVGVKTGRKPVGLASGYLQAPSENNPHPKQVIVVVTEGWIVMCFDHDLQFLWESSPVDEVPEGLYHEEVAIIIAPHPVRIGDNGIVVVGGRLAPVGLGEGIEHEHATAHVGPDKRVKREEEGHHFSYYSFDGKTGAMRWKHEEGDFFSTDPHEKEEDNDDEVESFMPAHSFKQHVFSQARHLGEVDWRLYKHHVLTHLPYRWVDGYDTRFTLDQFTKKTNFGRAPSAPKSNPDWNEDAIGIPNPLAAAAPFTTNQILSTRNIEKPNVIVATVKGGLEIVHLFTGRPLCRLMLPSLQATHSSGSYADINGDEVIDQIVSMINDPSNNNLNTNPFAAGDKPRCLAVATAGVPPIEQLWNGSTCRGGSSLETLVLRGFKFASAAISTTAPSFLPSASTLGLDSVFLVSSGRMTAYGPNGAHLWNLDSQATWQHNGYPVLTPIQILPTEPTLHMLALGNALTLVAPHGEVVATARLSTPRLPHVGDGGDVGGMGGPEPGEIWSVAPPVLGDFNNDGIADVVIVGHNGFYGFAIRKGKGSVLFPGLLVALICVMAYALVKAEGGGEFAKGRGAPRKRASD